MIGQPTATMRFYVAIPREDDHQRFSLARIAGPFGTPDEAAPALTDLRREGAQAYLVAGEGPGAHPEDREWTYTVGEDLIVFGGVRYAGTPVSPYLTSEQEARQLLETMRPYGMGLLIEVRRSICTRAA